MLSSLFPHLTTSLLAKISTAIVFAAFHANPQGNTAPLTISSTEAVIDEGMQTTTYLGDVRISQNGFYMSGESLVVFFNDDRASKILMKGNPAVFESQTNVIKKENINIEADTITYQTKSQLLEFSGSVKLRRLQNVLKSDALQYNLSSKKIIASSKDKLSPVRLIMTSE